MNTLTTFTLFPLLSFEIRVLIWQAALSPPRHVTEHQFLYRYVHERAVPRLLLACKESSSVFISRFTLVSHSRSAGRSYYLDLQNDIFQSELLLPSEGHRLLFDSERGIRIGLFGCTVDQLRGVFAVVLPEVLSAHPQLEIACILVVRAMPYGQGAAEDRVDYLRWLKKQYKPLHWDEKAVVQVWKNARGERQEWRELKLLFDVRELVQHSLDWQGTDFEKVEGLPDQKLAKRWDQWALINHEAIFPQ